MATSSSKSAESPKRRGCLRWAAYLFLAVALISAGGLLYILKGNTIASLRAFAPDASGGLIVLELDPTDPELMSLFQNAGWAQQANAQGGAFARRLLRSAVDPKLILLSRFDAEKPAQLRESWAVVVQFKRLSWILHRMARSAAASGSSSNIVMQGDAARLTPVGDPVDAALLPSAFVASQGSELYADVLAALTAPEATAKRPLPDASYDPLLERVEKSLGQVRGYLVNRNGRMAAALELARTNGGLSPEASQVLTPEVAKELDAALQAIFIEGELLTGDVAELSLTLVATSEDAAQVIEKAMLEHIAPMLVHMRPSLAPKTARQGVEVTVTMRITELRKLLEDLQRQKKQAGRRPAGHV